MQRAYGFYRDSRGMAAPGVQVRVYDFGTTNLSTIYDDEPTANPTVPKSNPFTTDANGYWAFAANTGAYTVQFNGANLPVYTINRIYLNESTALGMPGGGSSGQVLTKNSAADYDTKWSTITSKVVNEVMVMDSTVVSGTVQIPSGATPPQITDGWQYLSTSYTPASASNILLVQCLVNVYCGIQTGTMAALFIGNGPSADGIGLVVSPQFGHQIHTGGKKVAGTTSPINISVRLGTTGSAQLMYTNRDNVGSTYGGAFASYIKITEITP